jgi:membrane protease YdiL (CAAX protease family)
MRDLLLVSVKLMAMVFIPLGLMHALHFPWPQALRPSKTYVAGMLLALGTVAVVAVATPSISEIGHLNLPAATLVLVIPLCLVWVAVNAAIPEEVLFRVFLQSSLSSWIRSEVVAVVLATTLFALAHVPGLYLRDDQSAALGTHSPGVGLCVAYSLAVLSPAGILFGVIWSRTRSLVVLVIVHAFLDVLPNVAEFVHTWRY